MNRHLRALLLLSLLVFGAWVAPTLPALAASPPAETPAIGPGTVFVWDRDGDRLDDRIPRLPAFTPIRFLVAFDHDPVNDADIAAVDGVTGVTVIRSFTLLPMVWASGIPAAARTVASLDGVAYVQYDSPVLGTIDGDGLVNQTRSPLGEPAALAVKARENLTSGYSGAWRTDGPLGGHTGRGVRIAIVDGGIDTNHVSLNDQDGLHGARAGTPKVVARLNAFTQQALHFQGNRTGVTVTGAGTVGNGTLPIGCDTFPSGASCPAGTSLAGVVGGVTGDEADPAGEPAAVPRPHATAMAGIVAGTGIVGLDDEDADAGMPGARAGTAPAADLVDVDAYVPAAAGIEGLTGGQGVGVLVAAYDLMARYNTEFPEFAIDLALLPVTEEEHLGVTPLVPQSGAASDALTEAIDRLATFHPVRNPLPVLSIVSAGRGHGGDAPYVASPASARTALTIGATETHGTPCRGDDAPLPGGDRSNATQQAAGLLKPELVAPGARIAAPVTGSTDRYALANGTSAAAAVTAGVAALALQEFESTFGRRPQPAELKARIIETSGAMGGSDPTRPGTGWTPDWGYGYVDAARAVNANTRFRDNITVRIDGELSTAQVRVPGAISAAGRIIVDDPDADHLVRERGPNNTCRTGPLGPDTLAPLTWNDGDPVTNQNVLVTVDGGDVQLGTVLASTRSGADGRYGLSVPIGVDVPVGDHKVQLRARAHLPTDTGVGLHPATVHRDLLVRDIPRLDLDPCFPERPPECSPSSPVLQSIPGADSRLVRAHVTGSSGLPIPGITLQLEWGGDTLSRTTDTHGQALFEIDTGVPTGVHEMTLVAPGGRLVEANRTSVAVRIVHPTSIDLSLDTALPTLGSGDSATLQVPARLIDDYNGDPIAGRTLNLTTNEGVLLDQAITNTDGRAVLTTNRTALTRATSVLLVSFAGDASYRGSTSVPTQVAVRDGAILQLFPARAVRNATAIIQGILVPDAAPAGDLDIELLWQGNDIIRTVAKTGPDGRFVAALHVPPDERLGRIPLKVLFTGGDTVAAKSLDGEVLVQDVPRVHVQPIEALRNQTATVTGALLDSLDAPIANATIHVVWGGTPGGNATTDGLGRFRIDHQVPTLARLGPTTVRVRFTGEEHYRPAEDVQLATVRTQARPVIATTTVADGEVTLRGHVRDDAGAPLPSGGTVDLRVGRPSPPTRIELRGPAVDLTRARAPVLDVTHAYGLGTAESEAARAELIASDDNGLTWHTLPRTTATKPELTGVSPGWSLAEYDLTPHVGDDVRVRWALDSNAVGTGGSWFIDDVTVTTDASGQERTLYADTFDVLPSVTMRPDGNGWAQDGGTPLRQVETRVMPLLHPELQALQGAGTVAGVHPAATSTEQTRLELLSPRIPINGTGDLLLSFAQWLDAGAATNPVALAVAFDDGAFRPVQLPPPATDDTTFAPRTGWQQVLVNLSSAAPGVEPGSVRLRWTYQAPARQLDQVPVIPPADLQRRDHDLRIENLTLSGDRFAYGLLRADLDVVNRGARPSTVQAQMEVIDASGDVVDTLAQTVSVGIRGRTNTSFIWQPLAPGTYTLRISIEGESPDPRPSDNTYSSRVHIAGLGWFIDDVQVLRYQRLHRDLMLSEGWIRTGFYFNRTAPTAPGTSAGIEAVAGPMADQAQWRLGDLAPDATHILVDHSLDGPGVATARARVVTSGTNGTASVTPIAPRDPSDGTWRPASPDATTALRLAPPHIQGRPTGTQELLPIGTADQGDRAVTFRLEPGVGATWRIFGGELARVSVLACEDFGGTLDNRAACGQSTWRAMAEAEGSGAESRWRIDAPPARIAHHPGAEGGSVAGIGFGGQYPAGRSDALVSPRYNLTSATSAAGTAPVTLRFWHALELAADGDEARVEVSQDGGRTWQPLSAKDGSKAVHHTSEPGIVTDHYDLGPFAGRHVLLGLRLDTDGNTHPATWEHHGMTLRETFGQPRTITQVAPDTIATWPTTGLTGRGTATLVPVHADHGVPRVLAIERHAAPPPNGSATIQNGVFELRLPVSELGAHGTVPVTLTYSGVPGLVIGSRLVTDLDVPAVPKLKVAYLGGDSGDGIVLRGKPVRLEATIHDTDGAPLPGAKFTLLAGGRPTLEMRSHKDGGLSGDFTAPDLMDPGPQTWTLVYGGLLAESRVPAIYELDVLVKRLTDLDVRTTPIGSGLRVEGTLRDDAGRPMAGEPIGLHYGGRDRIVNTDTKGGFAAVVAGKQASHGVLVVYAGSATAASSAHTVQADAANAAEPWLLPLWAWAAVAAAVLLLVLLLVLLARRNRHTDAIVAGTDEYAFQDDANRAAIVALFERLLGRIGVAVTDTGHLSARELVGRALAQATLDMDALRVLTIAFERARFDNDPIPDGLVQEARAAALQLEHQLDVQAAQAGTRTERHRRRGGPEATT